MNAQANTTTRNASVSTARSSRPAQAVRGQSAKQADSHYFNAHLEGMGYLNNIREIQGKSGTFVSVQFCMLEGKPDSVEKIYISLTVPADDVKDLLTQHWDAINSGDEDSKVYAGLRLSHFRAEPFMYGANSAKSGQLGVNYSARAIKVMHLKVGSQTIVLSSRDSEAKTDYGVPAKRTVAPKAVPAASNDTGLFDKPLSVELRKDDPNFQTIADRLRGDGYRWHSDRFAWVMPHVTLEASNPSFTEKQQALVAEGYRSDDGLVYHMTFGRGARPQQARYSGNRH